MVENEYLNTISNYVEQYVGHTSTRHVSEQDYNAPPSEFAVDARRAMSYITRTMLTAFAEFGLDFADDINPEIAIEEYKRLVKLVPPGSEFEPTIDIDVYTNAGQDRYFEIICERVKAGNDLRSLGSTFLDITSQYIDVFHISPPNAAKMAMELIGGNFPRLVEEAKQISLTSGLNEADGIREALIRLRESFPSHSSEIKNYISQGFSLPRAHAQSLPRAKGYDHPTIDLSIEIYEEDVKPFIDAYHIQDKPYTDYDAQVTQFLIDENPVLLKSFFVFQMAYLKYSEQYLLAHPERMANINKLEPFSPIFIPCELKMDRVVLAPNPKLLKTMINNWGGAIASAYLDHNQGQPIQTLNPLDLSPEHIREGVTRAKELSLFRVQIGLFNKSDKPGKIQWSGILHRVCPAEHVFTQGGAEILPEIYTKLLRQNIT